jgi:hypothetical protein
MSPTPPETNRRWPVGSGIVLSVKLRHIDTTAENIRNVDSPDRPYPSALTLQLDAFSSGHLRVGMHVLKQSYRDFNGKSDRASIRQAV